MEDADAMGHIDFSKINELAESYKPEMTRFLLFQVVGEKTLRALILLD